MPCDACRAEVSRDTLHLSAEGQALCRQCYGAYLSKRATLTARVHDVYRRCTCGAVLAPMADPSATPYVEGSRGDLDLGFFLQSRKYECGTCGTNFVVRHVLMTSLAVAIILVFGVYGVLQSRDDDHVVLLLLLISGFVLVVAYDAYCRIRYPRVVSEE